MTNPRMRLSVWLVVPLLAVALAGGRAAGQSCDAANKCDAGTVQKDSCKCDGKPLPTCPQATGGIWLRIKHNIAVLLKAVQKGQKAKAEANGQKVEKDLKKTKDKVNKIIDKKAGGNADCKKAAAKLIDDLGIRVDDKVNPGTATTTTTTIPHKGPNGTGSLSFYGGPFEVTFLIAFTTDVNALGIYVPGRTITNDLPPNGFVCQSISWTQLGDSTPNNYYSCIGSTLPAGTMATGRLHTGASITNGSASFYGMSGGTQFGPFPLTGP